MSAKIKNQPIIARRKVLRKREQRANGAPAVIIAKLRFYSGLIVRHKIDKRKGAGMLVRQVDSGPDHGKWLVRWNRDVYVLAGPYVQKNLGYSPDRETQIRACLAGVC